MRAFLDALERSVQFLLNHSEEAWNLFIGAYPDLDDELNARAWRDTLPRFALRPAAFDKARYERFAAFLVVQGLLDEALPAEAYAVELHR